MWNESEHPRDKHGKFAKKDFADMSAAELKEYILNRTQYSETDENGLYKKATNMAPFDILPERMSKKHIRNVAKSVGIDLSGITLNIDVQQDLLKYDITGRADFENIGIITFFPNAFTSREMLIRTIYHEIVHVQQFKKHSVEFVKNNRELFEKEAYRLENDFVESLKKRDILDV